MTLSSRQKSFSDSYNWKSFSNQAESANIKFDLYTLKRFDFQEFLRH